MRFTKLAGYTSTRPGPIRRFSPNGNYRNGEWAAEAIKERRWLRSLVQAFAKKDDHS